MLNAYVHLKFESVSHEEELVSWGLKVHEKVNSTGDVNVIVV